jgi:hypothetical protein
MAKKHAENVTLQEIEDAILKEGVSFFRAFLKRHSNETIYSFMFEVSAVGYAIAAAVATEESLARHAEECSDDFDGDIERARNALRWAGPEEGWRQSEDKRFRISNKLLELAEEEELYPEYDGTLERIALSVIHRMVKEGIFGSADELEKVVLGICHTGGDNSEKDSIRWASAVNSPTVLKRIEAQLKQRA